MGILARSLEKRSIMGTLASLTPSTWGLDPASKAGPVVGEATSLRASAVLACVRVISETLASLPAHVYRRLDQGKERADKHPVYRLLHDAPNPLMSAYQFKETLNCHLTLWGNAYAEIVRGTDGRPRELWPIPPTRISEIQLNPVNMRELVYSVQLMDGRNVTLASPQVLHIPGLSFDGLVGKSPIRLASEPIGLALATEEFTSRFFSNGAQMSGVISHPATLSDVARANIKTSIEEKHTGIPNAFRVMLLEEGMKWEASGMKLVDAQLLELRKFQVEDIARIFRVPLHLISATEKSTSWGTGIEQFGLAFVTYCLRPWAMRWEQAIQTKLFLPSEQSALFIEYLFDSLYRGDLQSRYAAYAIARSGGWLNANEIREFENMNPIGGEEGTSYANPNIQSAPASPPAPAEPQDTPPPGKQMPMTQANEAFRPLYEAAWMKVLRRARENWARAEKEQTPLGQAMEDSKAYALAQLGPLNEAYRAIGGTPGEMPDVVISALNASNINDIARMNAGISLGG